jgi:MFS family permease
MMAGIVAILGTAPSVTKTAYGIRIARRLLSGIGEGGILPVSTAVLSQMSCPDRAYAQVLFINTLFGVALSFLMQAIAEVMNGNSIAFPLLPLLDIGLYPLMLLLPCTPRATQMRTSISVSAHQQPAGPGNTVVFPCVGPVQHFSR